MPENDIVSKMRELAERSKFLSQKPTIAGGVTETDLQRDTSNKIFTANPWEGAKASFKQAFRENITSKIGDSIGAYYAARENSEWLDPDRANELFQPDVPYTQPIKLSLAAYDSVVKERRREQDHILSRLDENALGSTVLPLAAGIGGSILDPAALAAGYGASVSLRALGTSTALNGTRFGKFIAQGSNVVDDFGKVKFEYGTLGQQISGEMFDQFVGNALIAPALPLSDVAVGDVASLDQMVEETIFGTLAGTGFSLGLRFLGNKIAKGRKGNAVEAETAMNQADEGLRINTEPIDNARSAGLKEAPVKETPDVDGLAAKLDIGSQSKPKPVGDFKSITLYVPMDSTKPGLQLHPSNTRLGLNTIQMTDSLAIARNTSFDPLDPTNQRITIGRIDYGDMKLLDADIKPDVPELQQLYTEMFGGEMPDGFTLRDFLEEASYIDAKALTRVEGAIKDAGYDGFSFREGNNVDGHNVIELVKGKDFRVLDSELIEESRNIDPEANEYLREPVQQLVEYARDYNNKIIADENRIEWKEPVTELPKTHKEEVALIKQEIADIEEELKVSDDLVKATEERLDDGGVDLPLGRMSADELEFAIEGYREMEPNATREEVIQVLRDMDNEYIAEAVEKSDGPIEVSREKVEEILLKKPETLEEFQETIEWRTRHKEFVEALTTPNEDGVIPTKSKEEAEDVATRWLIIEHFMPETHKKLKKEAKKASNAARRKKLGIKAVPDVEVIPEGVSGKARPKTTPEVHLDEAQRWAKENGYDLMDELDEEFDELGETFFDDSDRFDAIEDFEDPVELRESFEERMREQARERKPEEADEARSATKALDHCNKKRT